MKAVIYSRNREDISGFDEIVYQNPKYWRGNVENCDVVYADDNPVASAYRSHGIEVRPITEDHKHKLENKFDSTESFPKKPDLDYDSMSWPKLRSLASQISDEPVKSKKQALEVLKNSR